MFIAVYTANPDEYPYKHALYRQKVQFLRYIFVADIIGIASFAFTY